MIFLLDTQRILGRARNLKKTEKKMTEPFTTKSGQFEPTENRIFELALMQKSRVIKVLIFSKYASPIVA